MATIGIVTTNRDEHGYQIWTCQLEDGRTHVFRLVPHREREIFMFMRDMAQLGLGEEFFRTNPTPADIAAALLGKEIE